MSTAEARREPPATAATGTGTGATGIGAIGTPPAHATGPTRQPPAAAARRVVVSNWPMWVVGFTLFIDGMDQYIVRGSSNQIKTAFGVGDWQIGLLFSAFILVNGVVTMPAGYLADRWNRTRAMAVTIVAWSIISALGGLVPTTAFGLLVVIRASLGFGQAITDPSGSSVIADYYGTERRGRAFSIQQCLSYVGLGMGLALGGAIGPLFQGHGWRVAFFVSLFPGLLVAYMCWRLPEPSRGTADRAHVTQSDEMELAEDDSPPLFPRGFRNFLGDMVEGLHKDVGTILRIPTMRYALVGVSTVGFVVTAVATWMPNFYENQLHLTQQGANGTFGALAILGGIPGTIIGGRMADRWVTKFMGARVVIPAVCIVISAALFTLSFIPMPFAGVFVLQLAGFLAATACVPALRAGLSDAAPASVRGAGFGAFNLASVVFGAAAAPLVTSAIAGAFGNNYRTAFLIILPIAYLGAACLLLARTHIEDDAAKVFEAVVLAMAANQAEEAAYAAAEAAGRQDAAEEPDDGAGDGAGDGDT
ncbi:MAG TPA: MFS transporter [Acidimicrobiales bacterium]|nr:MFS transporter [Acidimicrobiales bacterium]